MNPLFQHSANEGSNKFYRRSLHCVSTTNCDPVQVPSCHFASVMLQAPKMFNDTVSDPYTFLNKVDDLPIVLDTGGASTSLTPELSDFIGPLEPAPLNEIRGLTASTRVIGKGNVCWTICH
jgi:hypothetical protein